MEEIIEEYKNVVLQESSFLQTWTGRKNIKSFNDAEIVSDYITQALNVPQIARIYNPGKIVWSMAPEIEAGYHPPTQSIVLRSSRPKLIVLLHELAHHVVLSRDKLCRGHNEKFLLVEREIFEVVFGNRSL
jgi:hypothetical protein